MDDVINLAMQLNSTNLTFGRSPLEAHQQPDLAYSSRQISVYDCDHPEPLVQIFLDLYVIAQTDSESQAVVQFIRMLDRCLPKLWEKLLYTMRGGLQWRIDLIRTGFDVHSLSELEWNGISVTPDFIGIAQRLLTDGGIRALLPFIGGLIYCIGKSSDDDGQSMDICLSAFSDYPMFRELRALLVPRRTRDLLARIRSIFASSHSLRSQVFFRIVEASDGLGPLAGLFQQILNWFKLDDCSYVWLVKDYLAVRHPSIFSCPEMKCCLEQVHHFVDLSSSLPDKYAPFVHLLSEEGHDPRPELLLPCQVAIELLRMENPAFCRDRAQLSFPVPDEMRMKAVAIVNRYFTR